MRLFADKYHGGVPTDHWHKFHDPSIEEIARQAGAVGAVMLTYGLAPTKVGSSAVTNFGSASSITQSFTTTGTANSIILTVWNTGITSGYASTAVSGVATKWYRAGSVVNATSSGAIDIWVGIGTLTSGTNNITITINGTHTCACNADESQDYRPVPW